MREVHTLEARYFERMAHSMGDKVKLMAYLPPVVQGDPAPTVLDVGAGGGEFAAALQAEGYNVTALDASDDAVMRMREKHPELTTVKLLANHCDQLGESTFDAVICSSILHEVFSYGDDIHSKGDYASLDSALQAFYSLLKPGGRLLIRDGVLPEDWDDRGTLTFENDDSVAAHIYLKMCPFSNGFAKTTGSLVQLTEIEPGVFEGDLRSLLEFAYTYTWGMSSYPRETQELYALHTLEGYSNLLQEHSFEVLHSESYLQPGYPDNLDEKLTLRFMDGRRGERVNEWFDSNAIWVAEKPV